MRFHLAVVFTMFGFGFVLAACDGNPGKASRPNIGVGVETQGGLYTNLTPIELKQLLANKNLQLVNVHIPYEGEIDQTDAFVPYNEIEQNRDKVSKDKTAMIVVYCRSGRMSKEAAETLVKLGYTNIWNLDRGMSGWELAGLPILVKPQ